MDEFERLVSYARKVARSTGHPQSTLATITRKQVQSKRLLGLRTDTSWIDDSVTILSGWMLWRQHMGQRMIVGDLRARNVLVDEEETHQIWLSPDGKLWHARVDEKYFVTEGHRAIEATRGEATREQLRQADFKWSFYEHKPDKRFAIDKEAHWNRGSEKYDKQYLGVSLALNQLTK
jgi:hypothetical protein